MSIRWLTLHLQNTSLVGVAVLAWTLMALLYPPLYRLIGEPAGGLTFLLLLGLSGLGGLRYGLFQALVGHAVLTVLNLWVLGQAYNWRVSLLMVVLSLALAALTGYFRAIRLYLLAQQEELARQARHDHLTGLANRRFFQERLEHEFARAQRSDLPMSVALLDIDHFKRINDGYSHAVGDRVLQEVARLLRAGVREVDLVSRHGGEEFAICLPSTSLDAALVVCDRLRASIEEHDWSAIEPGLLVTVSGGIYGEPLLRPPERMLARADARLYEAKHLGRNRIQCTDTGSLN